MVRLFDLQLKLNVTNLSRHKFRLMRADLSKRSEFSSVYLNGAANDVCNYATLPVRSVSSCYRSKIGVLLSDDWCVGESLTRKTITANFPQRVRQHFEKTPTRFSDRHKGVDTNLLEFGRADGARHLWREVFCCIG